MTTNTTTTAPTPQSIFNQVAEHLLTQNARSLDPDNARCAYRGRDDQRCAVGCLITDELYKDSMEDESVHYLPVRAAVRKSIDPQDLMTGADWDTTKELLAKLQKMHDNFEPEGWPKRLDEIATEFDLTPFTKE